MDRVESLPPETKQLLDTFTIIKPPKGDKTSGNIVLDESDRFFEASRTLMRANGKSDPDTADKLLESIGYDRDRQVASDLATVTRTLAVVTFDLLTRFDDQALSLDTKKELVEDTFTALAPGRDRVVDAYRQELRFRLGSYVTFLFDQIPRKVRKPVRVEAQEIFQELSDVATVAKIILRYSGVQR